MSKANTRTRTIRAIFALTAGCFFTLAAFGGKPGFPLSAEHKKWLNEEVVWIISKIEKETFLELKTDLDRNRFIESFWLSRDPSPGTPENEFREEHYRRIDYANKKFNMEGGPGWRTDRGRIYIQLGPPAQVFDWKETYHIYPCELWFYTNRKHPSLEGAFYVLFWEREGAGGYKIYSPYNDGVDHLVHGTVINGKKACFDYLNKEINAELARATLTLIPSEPVDTEEFHPSLTSDILIGRIFGLPEEEAPTGYLRLYIADSSKLKEKVNTRVSYTMTPSSLNAVAFPTVDSAGNSLLHWAMKISPKDLSVARYNDRYYASLDITFNLFDEEDKCLLRETQEYVRYFNDDEFERVKGQSLQFQDKVGVIPGKYKMDILVYNRVTQQTYTVTRNIVVPEVPAQAPTIGPLVPVDSFAVVSPGAQGTENLCFAFSGVRFSPVADRKAYLAERFGLLYGLYWPPEQVKANPAAPLSLEFRVMPEKPELPTKSFDGAIRLGQFNVNGTIMGFKEIPLTELAGGRYSVVLTVKNAEGATLVSATVPISLEPSRKGPFLSASSPKLGQDGAGFYDYQRSRILTALGRSDESRQMLERAVLKSPSSTDPVMALAKLRWQGKDASLAAELLFRIRENSDFPPEGHLLYAQALAGTGDKSGAEAALDTFMKTGRATRAEFMETATLYEQIGQPEKAAEVRRHVEGKSGTK